MSRNCWRQKLCNWIGRSPRHGGARRLAVVGIGHELRGDDAAGVCAARLLEDRLGTSPHCIGIPAGCAPENCTGQLRRFEPDAVLFLDAADMGEPPGTIRWLPVEAAAGISASTHSLPLGLLAWYLTEEIGCDVGLLGIQPARLETGSSLSLPVRTAIEDICATLARGLSVEGRYDRAAGTVRTPEVLDPAAIGHGRVAERWTR